ncbi:hypothetical protein KPL78_22965 [Roseomonas sp. HJA6]|uniref:Uncharacterized protein n=1 Tax=Roseomonas alba TaxID=2846776 RepID=A0ABS7AFA2_9PROT|nr:hypothetical protein [Neoroseomonas alba]MBW6400740.1 hypothetical protein [Neoroseomonas alba]
MLFILLPIWGVTMAVTGFAIFDLTGSTAAAWAAAFMPLAFAVTGLVPNGAWALPALAVAWALTARALPPSSPAPVATVEQPSAG